MNCRWRDTQKEVKIYFLHPSMDKHLAWLYFSELYSRRHGGVGNCIACCLGSLLGYSQSVVAGSRDGPLFSFWGMNRLAAPVQFSLETQQTSSFLPSMQTKEETMRREGDWLPREEEESCWGTLGKGSKQEQSDDPTHDNAAVKPSTSNAYKINFKIWKLKKK